MIYSNRAEIVKIVAVQSLRIKKFVHKKFEYHAKCHYYVKTEREFEL
jgi:hypothetical protein